MKDEHNVNEDFEANPKNENEENRYVNFICVDSPKENEHALETKLEDTHNEEEKLETIDVQFKEKKEEPKKKKRRNNSFFARHKSAVTIITCGVLSIGGGFGGTLLAQTYMDKDNVNYQSVIHTSANSNTSAGLSVKDVANMTMNSVVEIKTKSIQTGSFMQQAVSQGAGSGVVLTEDGYIVTNNHVISGASKIQVTTKDGKSYDATVVGTDSKTDLAVLKIDASGLSPVTIGDSSKLEVGDPAIAIGNPLGELGGTVTSGYISALDRNITIDGESMTLLQTDAAINPGNSGGGLFNDSGELIGVVNAKSSGSDVEGLGFAIPMNTAKDVIDSIINDGYVKDRPQMGISVQEVNDASTAYQLGVNKAGVYIVQIVSGGSADEAGLKTGDKLISIDGTEISAASDVKKVIGEHKAGDEIEVQYSRNDKVSTVKVTLQESKPSQNS